MSNKQSIAITTDPDFWQNVVSIALLRAAEVVYNESTGTTGHVARAALANKVVLNVNAYVPIFAGLIGCEDTFLALTVPQGNAITTATAQARIAAVWNMCAGV